MKFITDSGNNFINTTNQWQWANILLFFIMAIMSLRQVAAKSCLSRYPFLAKGKFTDNVDSQCHEGIA